MEVMTDEGSEASLEDLEEIKAYCEEAEIPIKELESPTQTDMITTVINGGKSFFPLKEKGKLTLKRLESSWGGEGGRENSEAR